ncbi:aldo/keto reductase [Bizionia paragorgiae]|uniref:Protein tas n=1 Tax=Bizionia paragorgiae TaxID=283786 RepID=A0A1H3VS01_BIZPA|nr:aldo/keto reductase [Bizionia paragorgiae]SDZ77593.1 Predicted oxidoreductase [Bizionia paragorgiae]
MLYTTLPNTTIKVSKFCLGSMTWGNQNTEAEGHKQLDYALDHGINFIDTAEMYPVPASADTQGRTSEIIGTWLKQSGHRNKVVLASKITGPGDYTAHIRTTGFSKQSLHDAVNNELKRLQTDYIDLFQLHWPERHTNTFGVRDYVPDETDEWKDNFAEVLESINGIIKEGKIGNFGLSNEKAWGTMRFLQEAEKSNFKKPITIQNPYSLLNRLFEGDLAEVSHREQIGLLAYSPMAFGVLSGKYLKKTDAANSRLNLFSRYTRYSSEQSTKAVKMYLDLAEKHQMSLAQMALAFVTQRPFVTSTIIGATNLEQLKENLGSITLNLSPEIISDINAIHAVIPNPAP